MDVSSTAESFLNPMVYHQVDDLTELDDGKIYRNPLCLMVKPWFPVGFPLNQSIDDHLYHQVMGQNPGPLGPVPNKS